MTHATAPPLPAPADQRDRYVDLLRAGCLLVVVVWHWVFSVISWRGDGPHASNPIGSTPGLWALTWVLQVMPAFFVLGGYANGRSWTSARRYRVFVSKRLGRLLVPTAIVVALALVGRTIVLHVSPDAAWVDRSIRLLLSPLWFLGVYVVLVLLVPVTAKLHERGRELGLLLFAGAAVWCDLLRFH
jgi:fucose 4-O-acetylase-like acetyltransferase